MLPSGPLVLLFYDGYELQALPGRSGRMYARARAATRFIYRSVKQQQVWTGFYSAFRMLRLALVQAGCDVRVNDFAAALQRPHYPIGLSGYPSVLTRVVLPNPVIFGPGDYGFPDEAALLAAQPRIRRLIQPSRWAAELYQDACGAKNAVWPVGIDTRAWPDASSCRKDLDIVIYDKIRWHREVETARVLEPIVKRLQAEKLTYKIIRYGHHHHREYRKLLRRANGMIFLCEHETQGLACQEALACNVPVLAWDEGRLVDPQYRRFLTTELAVSSVPYFDTRCGERFRAGEFDEVFSRFWRKVGEYTPRDYVKDRLSLARSAEDYLSLYLEICDRHR